MHCVGEKHAQRQVNFIKIQAMNVKHKTISTDLTRKEF